MKTGANDLELAALFGCWGDSNHHSVEMRTGTKAIREVDDRLMIDISRRVGGLRE